MCQCNTPVSNTVLTVVQYSLHDRSAHEALRHKWIESEKAGRDLGEAAIRNWVRHHWNGFLRAKWIEHVEGTSYWIELEHDDFGLLKQVFNKSPVTPDIFQLLKLGKENLDIILWARQGGHDMKAVMEVLETFNINRIRIESQLEKAYPQAPAD